MSNPWRMTLEHHSPCFSQISLTKPLELEAGREIYTSFFFLVGHGISFKYIVVAENVALKITNFA